MSSEQNRFDETVHNMVESVNKSNNDKIGSKNSNKNEGSRSEGNSQNESKTSIQLNQTSSNSSNNNLMNQSFSTFKTSTKDNLDQNHSQNHHQSHNNLSNVSLLNDSQLSATVKNNLNINALDLPPSKDTYKSRKKIYQQEKKKLAEQLLLTLNDPTLIVLADYLKVRALGFKTWTKVWCELRPGLLVIYKSVKVHKSGQWIGTVLLNITNVIERPSKKDGFCFKLFNVTDQNIWAKQGPKGETFGAVTLPLPASYLMFRAVSQQAGNRWIKAINLSFQSSKQIIRNDLNLKDSKLNTDVFNRLLDDDEDINDVLKDEHEIEREHFIDQDLTDENSSVDYQDRSTDSDTTCSSIENDFTNRHLTGKNAKQHLADKFDRLDKQQPASTKKSQQRKMCQNSEPNLSSQSFSQKQDKIRLACPSIELKKSSSDTSINLQPDQTEYVYQPEELVKLSADENCQVDLGGDENKSLLWSLLKQVNSSDLSKIVLPTFILEPRSFLEKLTDHYFHCDILHSATIQDDPFERMKEIVRWYLSGFYKKPNGLKKPFNPLLKETFRCFWEHPDTGDESFSDQKQQSSKTFYVAEQISHHPPISATHVVNRNQGYLINSVIQVSSRYWGNSVVAILHGNARCTLINRGEDYTMNFPYAHCKGILFGSLTFELGGKVEIKCERTNYSCELDFKLKPFLGGEMNVVNGKIRLGNETLATIDGHWDKLIKIKEKRSGKQSILWEVNAETFKKRLKRYVVPISSQTEFESQKLWAKVSDAIKAGDQKVATIEKTKLEDQQRRETKFRLENNIKHEPRLFEFDELTNDWHYKYEDMRPWDNRTDIVQFEKSFVIQTLTKHRTMSKTSLINPVESSPVLDFNKVTYSNLTPQQKAVVRRRSPKLKSKPKSSNQIDSKKLNDGLPIDQTIKKSDTNDGSINKFDSIASDENLDDTDYSSTFKNSSTLANQLIKRIEHNESEFKESLNKLKDRQQKLEKIILEERKKSSTKKSSFVRSLMNTQFLSYSNILTLFVLTVLIQLIIYKFNNNSNYLRK